MLTLRVKAVIIHAGLRLRHRLRVLLSDMEDLRRQLDRILCQCAMLHDDLRQCARGQNGLGELPQFENVCAQNAQQVLSRLRCLRHREIQVGDLTSQAEFCELLKLRDHLLRLDAGLQRHKCVVDHRGHLALEGE